MRGFRLVFSLTILLLGTSIVAQTPEATVLSFSGKVEILSASQRWVPAQVGMGVAPGDTVSTGFHSQVVLSLGLSKLTAGSLTRVLLRDLVKESVTTTTKVTVKIGRINASVKKAQGEKADFSVKGPASTASVRGTDFNFDVDRADYLEVLEGTVSLSNEAGQSLAVGPGERASVLGSRLSGPLENPDPMIRPQAISGGKLLEAARDQGTRVLQESSGQSAGLGSVMLVPQQAPDPTSVAVN